MRAHDDCALLLERLARVFQNDAHAEGLKPTQWEALRYLARANRFSRSPSAATAYLGVTKGTVSQTLTALERKGLICKSVDPADRRNLRLEPTAAGRLLLERDPVMAVAASIETLPENEAATLSRTLRRLLTDALARRGGRPFGICRTCRHFRADDPAGAPHRCALLDAPLSNADSARICVEQEPQPA